VQVRGECAYPGYGAPRMWKTPLHAAAALIVVFAAPSLEWALRDAPDFHRCMPAGPPEVKAAWTQGVGLVGFTMGATCLAIALRAMARGGERPISRRASVLAACVLALGLQWWIAGEGALILPFIVLPVCFGLFVSVVFVPLALLASLVTSMPVAWRWVSALAWWSALILVPGFVTIIASWNESFYC
jgi:hypothetical protein